MHTIFSKNVRLLSWYLHDAGFKRRDVVFNEQAQTLAIGLRRIYYEEPKEARFLFLFPCLRFRHINSRLELPNTFRIEYQRQDDAFSMPDDSDELWEINLKGDNILEFVTEHTILIAHLYEFAGILVTDTSEPTKRYITRGLWVFGLWVLGSLGSGLN